MNAMRAIAMTTLRGLLGRRRMILLLLLAGLPVLVALLIRIGGGRADATGILDTLGIRTILPLVALVVGTASIGSEIEDGTLLYQLIKPIPRWQTALAKVAVAVGVTVVLAVPPLILTGLLTAGTGPASLGVTLGFALAAMAGGAAYAVAFTAFGALTTRALIAGLAYTLLWEGVLAGLLEGTRFLSIRQATLGIAAVLTGREVGFDPLDPAVSGVMIGLVLVLGFLLTVAALRRFQLRAGD
jgi:ABC-2 type transport system permease protein